MASAWVGLIAGLQKYAAQPIRRASTPKLNVLNTALMSANSEYTFEQAKADRSYWGRLVESSVGAHLLNSRKSPDRLYYWREGSYEVDFVLARAGRIAIIEVKSGPRQPVVRGFEEFEKRFGKGTRSIRRITVGGARKACGVSRNPCLGVAGKFMNYFAPRTCTVMPDTESRSSPQEAESKPLEDFREENAYVLLGAPGAGKTEAFKREAEATRGSYVTARKFLNPVDETVSIGATLFIDGLDERRAGLSDGRTPLDEIRRRLGQLGRPRFRLSCREADWFGANDRDHLKDVSPDNDVRVIRLDPLPEWEVSEVLCRNFAIHDPEVFIRSAKEQGIGDLLSNPQTLRMLVEAVNQSSEQAFPRSRSETFDLACRRLLIEHNAEHQVAAGEPFGMDALMDAAGRLCVVQLLTGGQGFRLPGGASDRDFPGLDRIASEGTDKLRYAVRTKLFHMPSEGHVAPIHRQVAEFLAARYLAGLIRDGLPLRRVLSLMTGYDGVIVSELRGLSAWFTAHSKPSRAELVPRDPLGVVLYGDVRDFSVDEKVSLLDHLSRESKKNPWSLMKVGMDVRCGEIATQDMAGAILKHLQDPMRDEAPQSFIAIVIEMLCYGDPLPGIAKSLLDVARDDSRWPRIRCAAIDAFVQQRGDGGKARSELKDLLADVYSEKVRDTADDLLGQLLGELYPGVLSAPEILKYLRVPRKPDDCVKYEYFWAYLVPSRSTAEQLAELLDGLVEGYNELKVRLNFMPQSDLFLERLPILLLNVFLKKANEEIDCNRLFDWLGVARWVGDRESGIGTAAGARRVASWLQQRPGLWKTLWEKGLRRCIDRGKCADTEEFRTCMVMEQRRVLLDIASPRDLVRWHLDQALATDDLRAREWLMDYVAGCVYEPFRDAGISLAAAKERLAKRPALKAMFEARLNQHKENHARFNNASRQRQDRHQAERRRSQQKQRETIKSHEKALRGNQASPQILHFLAQAYLGGFRNVRGDCPRERLCVLVGDDDDLVEAVLDGLRGSIDRGDIPSDDEVIKLNCKSKRHILALPIVAGLEERASASPDCALRLSDKQVRLALAVHYTEPHWSAYIGGGRLAEQKSLWFPPLLKSHPSAVAEVLIKYARAKLQGRAESVDGLYELAHSQDHREVANMAALPLLKAFPARCNEARLQDLRHLLHSAALNRSGGDALADLIERKLANRSMNVGQRVYWLGAGLLVAPDKYVDKLDAYVAGRGRRIGNLERFLVALFDMPPGSFQLLSVSALKLLVRRVGATCKPAPASWESTFGEGGIIRQRMDAGLRVRAFIHRLASIPYEAAAIAFEELLSDDSLQAWRLEILDAADGQKKTRREGDFRHCSLEQALATLGNQGPANSADLAASTTDYLFEIARNIRDGNASDWRQYWNVDSHNRPQDARPEDACRDTLLSDLRERLLRQGIDAQPEGRYADDTRADIRVSYGGFNVPVETKRSCSRDLWSAIENQLIAKYARDPGADGYGIYLVFWFGNMEHCRPTPGTAGAPRSAAKLEQRLQGSLSEEVRRKISVCVIDVAAPGT